MIARALRDGDTEAFAEVATYIRSSLETTCAAYVGAEAAEDVVQEVLLKIWQNRARFDPARSGFGTWARAIARNAAIDHSRARTRRQVSDRSFERQIPLPPAEAGDAMIADETSRAVRGAAGALGHHQREAVFQAFWLGRTHLEIAGALGLPLGTVKGRVRLGLARIRETLDDPRIARGASVHLKPAAVGHATTEV